MVLGISGSGGLGREVLELARCIQAASNRWSKIVFIDIHSKEPSKNGAELMSFSAFQDMYSGNAAEVTIAIGEPAIRKKVCKEVEDAGYALAVLVHPCVVIPESTIIKPGVTVCANAFIACNCILGTNSYVQPHAQVSHDCVLGDHVVISPSANLAGFVTVGEGSFIGMGALVKENTSIGQWTIIGMGSVVYKDLGDEVVAIGNPARVIKVNTERRVSK
jgi:sugar O-acyltransferase (sialic acid O-acetyltransferase NeuD family)